MTAPGFYEESQGFAPWIYALLGVLVVVFAALATLRLQTRVEGDAVTVCLGFLHATRIPFSEIVRAEAVVYRPIRDYGGWGIRGIGRRRALNARGDRGVLLLRADGSSLLVGSQRPRDLLSALARAGVETEDKLPVEIREY